MRKPVVLPEATQELQASGVLEIIEARGLGGEGPRAGDAGATPARLATGRRPSRSQSSIAPVGLDLAAGAGTAIEEAIVGAEPQRASRRRRLGAVVIATVGGCALILIAAAVASVSRADDAGSRSAAASSPPAANVTPAPATEAAPAPPDPSVDTPSTGTLRLEGAARRVKVWVDGKRLDAASAVLSCGTHEVKVARGRTHSIGVPCGGEVRVSR